MKNFRYLKNVATLELDEEKCIGCEICTEVCPHAVLQMNGKRVGIVDRDACIECGACAKNCPTEALSVTPGVGCASYIIQTWIKKDKASCSCGNVECC